METINGNVLYQVKKSALAVHLIGHKKRLENSKQKRIVIFAVYVNWSVRFMDLQSTADFLLFTEFDQKRNPQ